jgi:hypothetical protein
VLIPIKLPMILVTPTASVRILRDQKSRFGSTTIKHSCMVKCSCSSFAKSLPMSF